MVTNFQFLHSLLSKLIIIQLIVLSTYIKGKVSKSQHSKKYQIGRSLIVYQKSIGSTSLDNLKNM